LTKQVCIALLLLFMLGCLCYCAPWWASLFVHAQPVENAFDPIWFAFAVLWLVMLQAATVLVALITSKFRADLIGRGLYGRTFLRSWMFVCSVYVLGLPILAVVVFTLGLPMLAVCILLLILVGFCVARLAIQQSAGLPSKCAATGSPLPRGQGARDAVRGQTDATQCHTDHILLAYLADRDVLCPVCRYNLRNLTSPICPECGETLALSVSKPAEWSYAWCSAVLTCASMVSIGLLLLTASLRLGAVPFPARLVPFYDYILIPLHWPIFCIPLCVLLIWSRRRFLRLRTATQWTIAGLSVLLTIGWLILAGSILI
jgi:hypothetical protein